MAERKGRKLKKKPETPEFDQQIVDLARVTRVTEGGKQLNFRVTIVIGDRKGRVGYGVAKGKDVQIAVGKAVNQAKKNMIRIPFVKETIPHAVESKFKAAKVLIKPAPRGSGIIAGGAMRTILELAGVPNASSKTLGKTNNKLTNVKATFMALQAFLPSAVDRAQRERARTTPAAAQKTEEKQEKPLAPKKPAPRAKKSVQKEDSNIEA